MRTVSITFDDDESVWRVEFDDDDVPPIYVAASTEKQVHVVLKRMYRAPRYDFDWEAYTAIDTGRQGATNMVRGDEPPFSVLEAKRYQILEHEKRVNQGGFKGIYIRRWNR